jgi:hypothetical protein
MCPIMGLKSAVMVVAGCETWGEVTVEEDADGSAEVDDSVGGWNDGGVASGSVVKRMPVDTVEKSSISAFLRHGKNVDGRRRWRHNLLRSSPWR